MAFFITAFIVYFLLLAGVVYKFQHKKTGLSAKFLIPAFAFKVGMAVLYGYLFQKFYNGDDTWEIHRECLEAWEMISNSPAEFFRQFLPQVSSPGNNLTEHIGIFFYNLEQYLISLILAPTVPLTGGNYYLMVIFLSAILFPAQCWLYSMLKNISPERESLYYLLIFWFAPVVFWLSGLRADGFIFLSLMIILREFPGFLKSTNWLSLVIILLAFGFIFILRPQVAMVIFPGLIAWWIAEKKAARPFQVFLILYTSAILLFFISLFLPEPFNPSGIFKAKQAAFLSLEGTSFYLPPLTDPVSWVNLLPYAIQNSFLRPFIWEARGILQIMASLESMLIIILTVLLFRNYKLIPGILNQNFYCFLLFFSIMLYISIGYMVPFPGAIVRYRIIGELFLLVILLTASTRAKQIKIF